MEDTQVRWSRLSTVFLVVGAGFLIGAFIAHAPAFYAVAVVWLSLAAYFSRKDNQTATEQE